MDVQKEMAQYENILSSLGYGHRSLSKSDLGYLNPITQFGFEIWYESQKAAKAQAVPEWIETAIQPPEEGQKVIISGIYGVGMAEFSYLYKDEAEFSYLYKDEFVMYDMGASNPILSKDQVKFWMPLPDAPQEPAND